METVKARTLDWLTLTIAGLVMLNLLPFLAPVFMEAGWTPLARGIYTAYSALCHQMAQRSFFLFGPLGFQMYEIAQLPVNLQGLTTVQEMLTLRAFVGDSSLGWKVAWSDRMVYMYTAPLMVAIWYAIRRRRGPVQPLSLLAFGMFLLPMAVDGTTHWLSDLPGLTAGFRYDNAWLAALTGRILPDWFYAGDGFGSFNSLMRLISGVTFGVGIGGLLFPYLDQAFAPRFPARQPGNP